MSSEKTEPKHTASAVEPLLELENVNVTIASGRGLLNILNGVTLKIGRGETLGLVGESGSGKSMTASAILGLLPNNAAVTSGSMSFDGLDLLEADEEQKRALRGARIGTILQDPTASLNPTLRVGTQVGEPLRVHRGANKATAIGEAERLLERVGIADAPRRVDDYPHQFSGGMRQRIVGAAAISCSPELIIADEPTTALDVTVQAAYLELLNELQRELGAALLFVSHDLGVVSRVCHRVAVMYAGRIVETAPTSTLFADPRHPYTMGLVSCLPSMTAIGERLTPIEGYPPDPANQPAGCPFASRCPAAVAKCHTDVPELKAVDGSGHQVACHRADEKLKTDALWPRVTEVREARTPEALAAQDATMPTLELDHVRKEYVTKSNLLGVATEKFIAVNEASFGVHRGEAVSIVGESGSGKTTCIKMALGLEPATSGRVLFEGKELKKLSRAERRSFHTKVQAVFQDPFTSFNPRMTIAAAVAEPLVELAKGMSKSEISDRVDEVLKLVGLEPQRVRNSYPHQLSGGQRQRVAIARAMSTSPDCLVLDEPVSALDVSIRVQVLNLLREVRDNTGVGILSISHDLGSVKYMSDRVLVMKRGEIVESGTAEQIYHDPQHDYTRQLLADALVSHG